MFLIRLFLSGEEDSDDDDYDDDDMDIWRDVCEKQKQTLLMLNYVEHKYALKA